MLSNTFSQRIRCAFIALALVIMIVFSASAGPGKTVKPSQLRSVAVDSMQTDSTNGIMAAVGNGSGTGEAVLEETLTLIPHIEDVYSIYIGFLGIVFDQDTGKVHQTRYTDTHFNVDGEITCIYPMGYIGMNGDFRIGFGIMTDTTYITQDTLTVPVIKEIVQNSYIRTESDDRFFILEYTIFNQSTSIPLTGGKVLFFCDIDVGNSAYDNLTGCDGNYRGIYQYSDSDDYAGFALIIPQVAPEFGNYNNWYHYGSDAQIDSIVAEPDYNDSLETYPGEYSSYMVFDIGDIYPGGSQTIAFTFSIEENLDDLIDQFDSAEALYNQYINQVPAGKIPASPTLLTLYPNPFNSSITLSFQLSQGGWGMIKVYNSLGQRICTVQDGFINSGMHQYRWDGRDALGFPVSTGIYFIQAELPGLSETRKIIHLR